MDYKRAINIITQVETEFDVNSVTYKDIKVWPLIRQAIWQQICHPNSRFMEDKLISNQKQFKQVNSGLIKLKKYLRPLKQTALDFKEYFKKIYANAYQNFRLHQLSPVDIVFFSRIDDYADFINEQYINRHIDPLIQLTEKQSNLNYLKLELITNRFYQTLPRFRNTVTLKPYLDKSKNLEKNNSITNFQELKQFILKISSIDIQENYFIRQAEVIENFEKFFLKKLPFIKPNQIFLVCYYYPQAMGLISACKKLNIITIDIQHGKQGKYHAMYSHWTKIPEEGYQLLPDYFWSWGQESRENIRRWHPKNCQHHQPIVGGNCWLGHWINGKGYPLGSEIDNFLSKLKEYDKVILITLQPFKKISDIIPDCLLQATLRSPSKWIWLIRLHPHQKSRIEEIQDYLKQYKIKNFELEQSTYLPLYALLNYANKHITCWSSVCYEALLFGVPTVIIHPTGLELYKQYIDEGKFSYAETSSELLNKLNNYINKENLKEEKPYIETDLNIAEETLNFLVKK